jgi:hypothetical protein
VSDLFGITWVGKHDFGRQSCDVFAKLIPGMASC